MDLESSHMENFAKHIFLQNKHKINTAIFICKSIMNYTEKSLLSMCGVETEE